MGLLPFHKYCTNSGFTSNAVRLLAAVFVLRFTRMQPKKKKKQQHHQRFASLPCLASVLWIPAIIRPTLPGGSRKMLNAELITDFPQNNFEAYFTPFCISLLPRLQLFILCMAAKHLSQLFRRLEMARHWAMGHRRGPNDAFCLFRVFAVFGKLYIYIHLHKNAMGKDSFVSFFFCCGYERIALADSASTPKCVMRYCFRFVNVINFMQIDKCSIFIFFFFLGGLSICSMIEYAWVWICCERPWLISKVEEEEAHWMESGSITRRCWFTN